MEPQRRLPLVHLFAIQLIIIAGYLTFMNNILMFDLNINIFSRQWYDSWKDSDSSDDLKTPPYCEVVFNRSTVLGEFKKSIADKPQALFVHFKGISRSDLQKLNFYPNNNDLFLDPLNLVWVEKTTAPFLALDLGFNVYSFTTLWRKVRSMSMMVKFESPECFTKNMTGNYSSLISSLATAFLTEVSEKKGALCYLKGYVQGYDKYRCCQNNVTTRRIECDIPASNPQMTGVFYTIVIFAGIFFLCFPAIFVSFPDEKESSDTLSANTQVSNPLYRIANCFVQKMRRWSAKYYLVHVIKRLLVGLLLPLLFYIDWYLTLYSAKYDIPKMFNGSQPEDNFYWDGSVMERWEYKALLMRTPLDLACGYGSLIVIYALLPRPENIDFTPSHDNYRKSVECNYSLIRFSQNKHFELDWIKPSWDLIQTSFKKFCFGFKGLRNYNGHTSLLWRMTKFVASCLLLTAFPFLAVYIFIGYGLYISPLGREIAFLSCQADIYFHWCAWRLTTLYIRIKKYFGKYQNTDKPNRSFAMAVRVIGLVILMSPIVYFGGLIIAFSLLLISRLTTHLYMGIVASKDVFLPHITLFSLFLFYIWNCIASVGNTYKDLLDQTFDTCKDYQTDESKQIIIVDKGIPRISRLSDLFQRVVDEILPFSKAYTMMCFKIVMIGLFLILTYFSILVFGKTSLNDFTQAFAVALGGLLPKFVEMFGSKNSSQLVDKENTYRVKKIVYSFFDSEDARAVKKDEKGLLDNDLQDRNPGEITKV